MRNILQLPPAGQLLTGCLEALLSAEISAPIQHVTESLAVNSWEAACGQNGIVWPLTGSSLVTQIVKNLLLTQETRIQSLGQEGPLEKELATHSSLFAWEIPWAEEPGGLYSP